LAVPQLTQERRKELVKIIKKKAEEGRVAVRNIRRDANESLKAKQKNGAPEDEVKRGQDDLQKLTDKYVKEIDETVKAKEQEIMQV